METIKFWFFTIVVLALLGLLGFWAFTSMQTGSEHAVEYRIGELEEENSDLKEKIKDLEEELAKYKPKEEEKVETEEPEKVVAYKHQSLISELEELIRDNINMKLNSKGTRVGTVQNFLNIYNNTSAKVDNVYGAGTKKSVAEFQKKEGLTADGNAGPTTYQKMIDWLKSQG